jgi:hypothetical protein
MTGRNPKFPGPKTKVIPHTTVLGQSMLGGFGHHGRLAKSTSWYGGVGGVRIRSKRMQRRRLMRYIYMQTTLHHCPCITACLASRFRPLGRLNLRVCMEADRL